MHQKYNLTLNYQLVTGWFGEAVSRRKTSWVKLFWSGLFVFWFGATRSDQTVRSIGSVRLWCYHFVSLLLLESYLDWTMIMFHINRGYCPQNTSFSCILLRTCMIVSWDWQNHSLFLYMPTYLPWQLQVLLLWSEVVTSQNLDDQHSATLTPKMCKNCLDWSSTLIFIIGMTFTSQC